MNPPQKPTHPAFIDKIVPDFAPIDPTQLAPGIEKQQGLVGKDQVDGGSKYDPQFTPLGYDLQEHRAQHQTFLDKAGNGIAKAVGNGLGMVGTIGGLAYGAGKAMATGDIRDVAHNELAERVETYNNWLQSTFPHYETQKEQDSNFLSPDNLLTWNQLFGGVVSNLGFSFGAGVLTKGVTKTLASAIGRMALGGAEGLEALAAAKGVGEGSKLISYLTNAARSQKFVNATSVLGGSLVAGAVEAQQESQQNYTQTYQQQVDNFHKEFPGVELPDFKKKEFEQRASSSSLSTYLLNTALLGSDNFLQFGKSMMGGYKPALKQQATSGIGKFFQRVEKVADRSKLFFSPSEGFEEGAQNAIQAGSSTYFSRKKDPKAWGDVDDLVLATTKGLHEALETKEGKNAILTGGLSGGPSVAVHNILSGEGTGWNKQDQEFAHAQQVLADLKKQREENPLFAAAHDNVVRHTSYLNSMQEAVRNQDVYQYENLRHDALKSRVQFHTQTGTLSKLQDELDTVGKMDNSEFQKMFGLDEQDFTQKDVSQYVAQLQKEVKRLSSTWQNVETRFPQASDKQKEVLYDTLTNIGNRDQREKELNGKLFQASGIDYTTWSQLNPGLGVQEYAQQVASALKENPGTGEVTPQDLQDFLRLKGEREELVNTYQSYLAQGLHQIKEDSKADPTLAQQLKAVGIQASDLTKEGLEKVRISHPELYHKASELLRKGGTAFQGLVGKVKSLWDNPGKQTEEELTSAEDVTEIEGPQTVETSPKPSKPSQAPKPSPTFQEAPEEAENPQDEEAELMQEPEEEQAPAPKPSPLKASTPLTQSVQSSPVTQGQTLPQKIQGLGFTSLVGSDSEGNSRVDLISGKLLTTDPQAHQEFEALREARGPEWSALNKALKVAPTPKVEAAQDTSPESITPTKPVKKPDPGYLLKSVVYTKSMLDEDGKPLEAIPYSPEEGDFRLLHEVTLPNLRSGKWKINSTQPYVKWEKGYQLNLYTIFDGSECFLGFLEQSPKPELWTPEQALVNGPALTLLNEVKTATKASGSTPLDLQVIGSLSSLPAGVVGESLSSEELDQRFRIGGQFHIIRQTKTRSEGGGQASWVSGGGTYDQSYPNFHKDFPDAPSDGLLLVVPTLDGKGKKLVGLSTAPAGEQTFETLTSLFSQELSPKKGTQALRESSFLAANQGIPAFPNLHTKWSWEDGGPVVYVDQTSPDENGVNQSKIVTKLKVDTSKPITSQEGFLKALSYADTNGKEALWNRTGGKDGGVNLKPRDFFAQNPVRQELTPDIKPSQFTISTTPDLWGKVYFQVSGKKEVLPNAPAVEAQQSTSEPTSTPTAPSPQAEAVKQAMEAKKALQAQAKKVRFSLQVQDEQKRATILPTNYQQARKNIARILPKEFSLESLDRLLEGMYNNGKTWGAQKGQFLYLYSKAPLGTEYHEAFHAAWSYLVDPTTKRKVEAQVRAQLVDRLSPGGLLGYRQAYGDRYAHLSDSELTSLIVEEHLADAFQGYMNKRGTPTLFQKAFRTLKKVLDWFKSRQAQPLEELFGALEAGRYKRVTPNFGETQTLFSLPIEVATGAKSDFLVRTAFLEYVNHYSDYQGKPEERFATILEGIRAEQSFPVQEEKGHLQTDWLLANRKSLVEGADGNYWVVDDAFQPENIPLLWKEVQKILKTLNLNLQDNELVVSADQLRTVNGETEVGDEEEGSSQEEDRPDIKFDQNSFSLTGIDSLSRKIKAFITLLGTKQENSQYKLPATVLGTFSLLQRALKGTDTYGEMLSKLQDLAQGEPGGVVEDLIQKLEAKKVDQFFINQFTRAFKVEYLPASIVVFDQEKGKASLVQANQQSPGKLQANKWNSLYNKLSFQGRDLKTPAGEVKAALQNGDMEALYQALPQVGIPLSKGFLLSVGKEKGLPYSVDQQARSLVEDLTRVVDSIAKGTNPYVGENTATVRLEALGKADAAYRSDVYESSYQNAEGETMYSYTAPSFEYVRSRKLQEGTHGLDFQGDYLSKNYLVQHFAKGNQLEVSLGLLNGFREKTQAEGLSTKSIDPKSLLLADHTLFQQGVFRWAVHEAKATVTTLQVGKDNLLTLVKSPGKMSDHARKALKDLVAQDKARIQKVRKELYNSPEEGKLPASQLVGGYHFLEKYPKSAPDGLEKLPAGFVKGVPQVVPQKLAEQYVKAGYRNLLPTGLQYTQFPELNSFQRAWTEEELDDFLDNFLQVATDAYQDILDQNQLGGSEHMKYLAGKQWKDENPHYEQERAYKENYVLTDFILSNAFAQLVNGEEAFYLNHTNHTKRNAGLVASGTDLGEGNFTTALLTDEETPLTESTFGDYMGKGQVGSKANGTDAQSYVSPARFQFIKKQLGYSTPETDALIGKLIAGQTLTPKEVRKVMEQTTANPIKGVYFDGETYIKTSYFPLFKDLTSTWNEAEQKWEAKAGREGLHHLREILEGEVDGSPDSSLPKVDEVHRVSASKLQRKGLNFPKADGTYDRATLTTNSLQNKYWRLQVENPSGKTKITQGTQLMQLIDSEMDDSQQVEYQGKPATIGEVRKAYQSALALTKEKSYAKASKVLDKVLYPGTPQETSVYLHLMQDMLRASGAPQNRIDFFEQEDGKPVYSQDLPFLEKEVEKAFLSFFNKQVFNQKVPGMKATLVSDAGFLNPQTGKRLQPHKLTGGEWVEEATSARDLPIGETMKLYREKVMKYVRSRGGSVSNVLPKGEYREFEDLVAAIALGLPKAEGMSEFANTDLPGETSFEQRMTNDNLVREALQVTLRSFEKEEVYTTKKVYKGGQVTPAEVMLSEELLVQKGMTKEEFFSLPKDQQDKLVTMLGFRIPTQSHHSMIPFKVVDFLPAYYGSVVVAPAEITYLSGADFDVDSLFINRREFRVLRGNNGEFQGVSIHGEESPQERYQNWLDYTRENDKLVSFLTQRGQSFEQALETLGYPTSLEGYLALPEKAQKTMGELSNQRLDAELSFILNPHNAESLFTPATIDRAKDLRDTINDLYGKQENTSLPYNTPSVRFTQWQAVSTGKANVGPAANSGKTGAFLQKNGVELNPQHQFTFSGIEVTGFASPLEQDVSLVKQEDGSYALGEPLVGRKADSNSTLTSGMTDDAKERLSFGLNLSQATLPVFGYAVNLGLGLNRVVGLFGNQPILRELNSRYQQANAQVQDNKLTSYKLAEKMMEDMEKALNLPADGVRAARVDDQEMLTVLNQAESNLKKVQTYTQDGEVKEDDRDLLLQQVDVLRMYVRLESQTAYFNYTNKLLNSNKGLPITVQETKDYFETPFKALAGDNTPFRVIPTLVEREHNIEKNLNLILSGKDLGEKLSLWGKDNSVLNLAKNRFLVASPTFNSLKAKFQGMGGRNTQLAAFEGAFLTHLTMLVENQQVLNTTGKPLSDYQHLLTGKDKAGNKAPTVVDTLSTLLSEAPDNLFLNQLIPKGPDPLAKNGRQYGNPFYRVEYNTRAKNEADFVDQLSAEFLDLFLHPNPQVVEAAKTLRIYLSVKDGLQFKNNSFISLAKPQLFYNLSNGFEENGKKVVGLKEVSDLIKQGKVAQAAAKLGVDEKTLERDFFSKWYSSPKNLEGLEGWVKYKEVFGETTIVKGSPNLLQVDARDKQTSRGFPLAFANGGHNLREYNPSTGQMEDVLDEKGNPIFIPKNAYVLVREEGRVATYQKVTPNPYYQYQEPWAMGIQQVPVLSPLAIPTSQPVEEERKESGAPTLEESQPSTYSLTSPEFLTSLNENTTESDLGCVIS